MLIHSKNSLLKLNLILLLKYVIENYKDSYIKFKRG